jgi:hypothetical protein
MNGKIVKIKDIKYTILYCVCLRDYGSGSAKVRNKIKVPVPLRQNVTVPVPQNCCCEVRLFDADQDQTFHIPIPHKISLFMLCGNNYIKNFLNLYFFKTNLPNSKRIHTKC